jgi:hypothetical protein
MLFHSLPISIFLHISFPLLLHFSLKILLLASPFISTLLRFSLKFLGSASAFLILPLCVVNLFLLSPLEILEIVSCCR